MTAVPIYTNRLAELMPNLIREFSKRQVRELVTGEVTIPQVLILEMLVKRDRCKMSELAGGLSVSMSAATGLVDRMVKSNLVSRARDEKDRRVVMIQATRRGRRIIDRVARRRHDMLSDIIMEFEQPERENFLKMLEKMHGILKKGNGHDKSQVKT